MVAPGATDRPPARTCRQAGSPPRVVGAIEQVEALTAMVRPDAGTPEIQLRSALALALVERTDAAEQRFRHYLAMADVEAGSDPAYRIPAQALIAIQRGRPNEAIEILASVKPYEVAFACIPTYVRGLAHRRAGRPREAAAEFAAITTHRSLASALIYPVAWLQLGRARGAAGDKPGARQAYATFLQLWKDADPDVPALQQAREELRGIRE